MRFTTRSLLHLTLVFVILAGYFRWGNDIDSILENARETAFQTRLAMVSFRQVNERTNTFTKQQMDVFNSPLVRKSIADGLLYLRSGNDFARLVDQMNVTLRQFNSQTLPALTASLRGAALQLEKLATSLEPITQETREAITSLRILIEDENIKLLLLRLALSAENVERTTRSVSLAAGDVQQGLPVLVKSLTEATQHIASGTQSLEQILQAVKSYVESATRPLSTAQKVLAFLLRAVAQSLPVLIRR